MPSIAPSYARPSSARLPLALLLPALLLAPGCGGDGTKPPPASPAEVVLPLTLGSRWTYQIADTIRGVPIPTYPERTDSIAAIAAFDDGEYAALATLGGTPDTSWFRQEGQRLYLRLTLPAALPEDPEFADLAGALRASLPWRAAEFSAPAGASWELLHAVDTLRSGGFDLFAELRATATSLGRAALTVPAGSYGDAAGSRLELVLGLRILGRVEAAFDASYTFRRDLWFADGIGVVQRRERMISVSRFSRPDTSASTARLRRFALTRP